MISEINQPDTSRLRIPTLLGLAILIIGLVGGVFLATQGQVGSFRTKAATEGMPQNITVANISANSVSIYWQTKEAVPGFIQAGLSPSLGLVFRDERDPQAPKPHKLHFVTLNNLTPDTTYYYKISSGPTLYPANKTLSFKTAPAYPFSKEEQFNQGQPVIGTVIDLNSNPIDEALVVLEIPGAQNLATITKVAGNFVVPLKNLYNQTLDKAFTTQEASLSATLTVFNLQSSSKVILPLPVKTILPPVTLGKDVDLTTFFTASPSASRAPIKYDLNKDGVVNALDASIIFKNFGPVKKTSNNLEAKEADLNQDGVVDQKDIEIISPFIPNIAP